METKNYEVAAWLDNRRFYNREKREWEERAWAAEADFEPPYYSGDAQEQSVDWESAEGQCKGCPEIEDWLCGAGPRPVYDDALADGAVVGFCDFIPILEAAERSGEALLAEMRELLVSHFSNLADEALDRYSYFGELFFWEAAVTPETVRTYFAAALSRATTVRELFREFSAFRMGRLLEGKVLEVPEADCKKAACGLFRRNFLADLLAAEDTIKNHTVAGARLAYYYRELPIVDALAELYNALLSDGTAVLRREGEYGVSYPANALDPFLGWLSDEFSMVCKWRPLPPFVECGIHKGRRPVKRLDGFWRLRRFPPLFDEPVDSFDTLAAARMACLRKYWRGISQLISPEYLIGPRDDERFKFGATKTAEAAAFARWLSRMRKAWAEQNSAEAEKPR